MTNIKKGFFWSAYGKFFQYAMNFVSGIILARLLEPKDYGLVGLLAIFISISTLLIDSGYKDALIRNSKENTNKDFTAVFIFNLFVGTALYIILFSLAPYISSFFHEPLLTAISRVAFISIILNSISIVQVAKFQIELNFKILTQINIIVTLLSTVLSVSMAFTGYGVWALVIPGLISSLLRLIVLFYHSNWKPEFQFSSKILYDNFKFSIKLIGKGLSDHLSYNLIQILIGKNYSIQAVGYYTKANTFFGIPNNILTTTINEVSYPVFAKSDIEYRKILLRKMIRYAAMISFPLSIGMIVIAKPMILVLIGEKWADTIPILQVLSIMISVMSLIYLNNSMLKLLGKVNLLLWSSLLKNVITIVLLFLTMKYGIIVLCLSYVLVNTLVFFLYAFISGRLTGYRLTDQIKDIIPFFVCSIVMGIGMYIPLDFISLSLIGIFGSQIIIGLLIIISLYYFLFKKEFYYLLNIFNNKVSA